MNIVIPMAGKGKRFLEAGYKEPKFLIDVRGKPMIQRVIEGLRPDCDCRIVLVCLREHLALPGVEAFLKGLLAAPTAQAGLDWRIEIAVIPEVTQGAACSVLAAIDFLHDEEPLLIANSDQIVEVDINDFLAAAQDDGLIMTFPCDHPKWSYARIEDGKVVEVAEKKVISAHATVGIYWFRQAADFFSAALAMIEKEIRCNGEFYVCPVYNELIKDGKTIRAYEIEAEAMHGLGTPEDLEAFLGERK